MRRYLAVLIPFVSLSVLALAQSLPSIVSPELQKDGRVTFRFHAPNAAKVEITLEGQPHPFAMQKDDKGTWTVTLGPYDPDIYGYSIVQDGQPLIDPSNQLRKPNLLFTQSAVEIPGPGTASWEVNDIPHGELHHHFFHSKIANDNRDFFVYTPPNYDASGNQKYPVLYLLHGFSDDATGWTAVGRANIILDNLIAQGKATPMVIVMPLGYGAPEIVVQGPGAFATDLRKRNYDRFMQALFTEVMPQVETTYRVSKDRKSRAIAGLSMGGAESLLTGLNNLDKFVWVGAFSSGGYTEDFDGQFPGLDAKANEKLRLLWIACGTDDRLIDLNRKVRTWLDSKGIHYTPIETPGGHVWMVWRRNLAEFTSLLFK
jgi:enterochelin esterase family protein